MQDSAALQLPQNAVRQKSRTVVHNFQLKTAAEKQSPLVSALDAMGHAPFAAVSVFKRIPNESLARIVGVSERSLELFFKGSANDLSSATKLKIADLLGIDLKAHALSSRHVHFFYVDKISTYQSKEVFVAHMNALNSLIGASRVIKIGLPTEKRFMDPLPDVFALQNDNVRALFYSKKTLFSKSVWFNPSLLSDCKWASKNSNAVLDIVHSEHAKRIVKLNINTIEFDEIFDGKNALCWADVEIAARKNLVSKRDVISWIESQSRIRTLSKERGAPVPLKIIRGGGAASSEPIASEKVAPTEKTTSFDLRGVRPSSSLRM